MTTTTGVPKPAALPFGSFTTGETVGISLGYADMPNNELGHTLILPPIPAAGGGYMNTGAVVSVRNYLPGLTLSVAGGGTIDGVATFVVPEVTTCTFITTSTEYTLWKSCANGEPPEFALSSRSGPSLKAASMPAKRATPGEPTATLGEPTATLGEPTATPGEPTATPGEPTATLGEPAADEPAPVVSAASGPVETAPEPSVAAPAPVSATVDAVAAPVNAPADATAAPADAAAPSADVAPAIAPASAAPADADFVVIESPPSAPLNRGKK